MTLLLLLVAALGQSAQLLANSSHSSHDFQLALSLAPGTLLRISSQKIAPSLEEWLTLDASTSPATISPPLQQGAVLVNAEHEGRSFVHLYQPTSTELQHRHFHHLAVELEGGRFGLLLPQFSQMVPALRTDRLFRCSNSIVSVEWVEGSAHVVIFSQHDRWRLTENIDGGFMSDERGVHYGYAIDYGHIHPVRISIGEHQYCLISQESAPAVIEEFDWQEREDYSLDDLLFLAQGGSVPLLSDRGIAEEL